MLSIKDIAKKLNISSDNESNRIAWVKSALEKIPDGLRILDAGAGEKQYKPFCEHLNYVSQDFGQYDGKGDAIGMQMGEWDQSNLDIVCDIAQIPESDNSFDAILCTEVFEHIPHPIEAIQEFSRLVKSGGHLIITAPFCSFTHFAPYHYYSGYNTYFWEHYLPKHGFKITEMTPNGNFFEYVAQEVSRIYNASNEYASKKPYIHELIALYLVVKMLKRFSKLDKNSSSLACFGYHVKAIKI